MRRVAVAILVLAALPMGSSGANDSVTMRSGAFVVEIGDHGLLTGVPGGGLRNVDGPRVWLHRGDAEWFGVAYDGPGGHVERVGLGLEADWARRTPVRVVEMSAAGDKVVSLTRAGDLEIRSDFAFDGTVPRLLARITLTNRGSGVLRNVLYTREWKQAGDGGWTFPFDVEGVPPAPAEICRQVWMFDDLAPGAEAGLVIAYEPPPPPPGGTVDVPLSLWTNDDYPSGVPVGGTFGISWGDYDADGFIDMFACHSGNLWRNVGGSTWEFAADLDGVIPPTSIRYGSSFGDYNNDGLADIGTEPRRGASPDNKLHLARNLGGGANFVDVATDPDIIDVQPWGDSETYCWGDVNDDGWLDLFVPVYPAWAGANPGNFFLFNRGPTGPGGAYRFNELSASAGLDNPPGSARPEGAQFVDIDFDGDIDLYSNGTLYRNVSSATTADFDAMNEPSSGIGLSTSLDEGAVFFDYDLDGDYDLFVVYTSPGVRIWESYGDGTFFAAELAIVDDRLTGLNLGMSAEDWDNDGDIDFTTRQVFRRNMLLEEGARHFTVATHTIPSSHLTSATPAWGDWDLDGDLDCALGNWASTGHFYENTTYGEATPAEERRHLRVRAVRDSKSVPAGLETEFGASVELRLLEIEDVGRRKKFVASGHGYLNQNEYALHFALPPDPFPGDPEEDLRLDVTVDFPGRPARGLQRIDRHVNPALGGIHLADLTDREIRVSRCGTVVIDGVTHEAAPLLPRRLVTTTGGLRLAGATTPLPAPVPAPGPSHYVGLAFDTLDAADAIRIGEILLDGQLDAATPCGNLALWDVTEPGSPQLVPGGGLEAETSLRNRRSYVPVDLLLPAGREYRLVARVNQLRETPIDAPVENGDVRVLGGLEFDDVDPCSGAAVAAAALVPDATAIAFRFRPRASADELDPVGNTLLVSRSNGRPVLDWQELSGPVLYEVLRCDAADGACTPESVGTINGDTFVDYNVSSTPGEHYWYKVRPLAVCQPGP